MMLASLSLLTTLTLPAFQASGASFVIEAGKAKAGTVKRVTNRPGNTLGTVPIIMYHRFGDKEENMIRARKNFKNDLKRLHKLGFRPVTLEEFASDRMNMPPGASPVVMTFDDSHPDQFRYLPDGSIDPNCAVGMWLSFAKKNPDFPVKATFFILPNGPFGSKAQGQKKIDTLLSWGCEIGSHAWSHKPLTRFDDHEVMNELAASVEYCRKLGVEPRSFAPPYGIYPKNLALAKEFVRNGHTYKFHYAVLAGSEPNVPPDHSGFNRHRMFRIQAYEGFSGITFWLNRYEHGKKSPYVEP